MGFKDLKSLCFRDCGAGHVSNSAQHPCFLSNLLYSYLLHFSSELCKDSLESSFNVECAHGLR